MSGCRHFDVGRCRSCTLLEVPIEKQHLDKLDRLRTITGIEPEGLAAGPQWHFRDKIKMSVTGTIENPVIGLLQENLSAGIELLDCPVQAPALNEELPRLKEFITKWKLTPYQILERKGELKGIILSFSPTTGEKMLRFVLRSKEAFDRIRLGLPELSQFTVVSVNIQPIPHALLEGEEEIILSERKTIRHSTEGIQLLYSPQSFMQTNSAIARQLYADAAEWLAPWRGEKVLDLFCGVGGFALHLARAVHPVHGVEINSTAVANANAAAADSNLTALFTAAPAENVLSLAREWGPHIIIVNPPRRGLAASLKLIQELSPVALLYSSCSPESLQKDLDALRNQYLAKRTKLYDMFPNTHHFESLTLLVRR